MADGATPHAAFVHIQRFVYVVRTPTPESADASFFGRQHWGTLEGMKGLSVLLTILLLLAATRLAGHMKRAGTLPAQNSRSFGVSAAAPQAQSAHQLVHAQTTYRL